VVAAVTPVRRSPGVVRPRGPGFALASHGVPRAVRWEAGLRVEHSDVPNPRDSVVSRLRVVRRYASCCWLAAAGCAR